MSLVQNDIAQSWAEEVSILRPAKHVLQHRVVGDDDIRDILARGLPAPPSTGRPHLLRLYVAIRMRGFAGEVKKTKSVLRLEQLVKPGPLIGHERVHRIEDQAPHPSLCPPAGFSPESRQDRQKERFRFTGARSCRNHEGGALR